MISDTTSLDSVSCQVVEALNKVEGIIGGDGGKPGKTTACAALLAAVYRLQAYGSPAACGAGAGCDQVRYRKRS
ncbi:Uncharacterized protein ALO82_02702 [Pseudomonas syringae pv. broussonetiae]|nr:Uncharacterized protein ALO82_02702 [Pseudomonas syringae pv. broussonetiae]